MKNMSLEKIALACHGSYFGPEENKKTCIEGVVIDSRQVEEGFLFVAIKGEKVDGHRFVPDVLKNGAAAVLVEHEPEGRQQPYILVESSTCALKDLAKFYLSGLQVKVVGITGSVGKTSTKETIASVLKEKYAVLKTEGNYNNEIGLPLTVFKIREEHEIAVLEMGISEFGEMDRLSEIANPEMGVITNIGVCHLENLKTRDGILKAKTEMFRHLKEDGIAILNGDDDKLRTITTVNEREPIFFGIEEGKVCSDEWIHIFASDVINLGLEGMQADIHFPEETFTVRIATPGRHNVYNALAAACVGRELGLSIQEIRRGLERAETIKGRTNLIHTETITIIDDCYNANPVSMKEAINVLDTARGRKIAVLGDMGELGEEERALHYEVGEHLAGTAVNAVFLAGALSEEIAKALECQTEPTEKEVFYFTTKNEMLEQLVSYIKKGDTVLVKASHFMEFPEVVEKLKDYRNF